MEAINDVIKKSKSKLGEKIPCSIEILTPVHIGSGVKLAKNIDFYTDGRNTIIVPQSRLIEYLEENPQEVNNFLDERERDKVLKKIDVPKEYIHSLDYQVREILQFVRNGNSLPYIPGSSIKGSIRTAILHYYWNKLTLDKKRLLGDLNWEKKELASAKILEAVFGNSSNTNLMRAFQIFDSEFSNHQITLNKVTVYTLLGGIEENPGSKEKNKFKVTGIGIKNFSPVVESIAMGSKFNFSFSLNSFLWGKEELKFDHSFESLVDLVNNLNNYANFRLDNEIKFFTAYNFKKQFDPLIQELNNLKSQIPGSFKSLAKLEFLLRISWGSGWNGMTGDYLTDQEIEFIRNKYFKYKLGKKEVPIFPKTRKVILEEEKPRYVTGWVKIRLNDSIKPNTDLKQKSEVAIDDNNWAAKLSGTFKVTQKNKK